MKWEEYRINLKNYLNYKPNLQDIVIDIGACVGEFALGIAPYCKTVIAVEPDSDNCNRIHEKKQDNVLVKNEAVYSASHVVRFRVGKSNTTGELLSIERRWGKKRGKIYKFLKQVKNYALGKVRYVYATDFQDLVKAKQVKLMKIDCEGSEYEFLLKVPEKNIRQIEYYCIEAHPTMNHNVSEFVPFFKHYGYAVVTKPAKFGCLDVFCKRI